MKQAASLAAALGILLGGALGAQANGRPPATNGVTFRPGDPDSLYIATTFGLLISHDGGCTVRWVCESNLGYGAAGIPTTPSPPMARSTPPRTPACG